MHRLLIPMLLFVVACPEEEEPAPVDLPCYEQEPEPSERSCLTEPEPFFDADEPLPERLSETGCFTGSTAAPELVRYEVASPLWTDGSRKRRWLMLPRGGEATDRGERWDLPVGSVVFKEFAGDDGPIETRVLLRTPTGWRADTYRWQGDDAVLLAEPETHPVEVDGRSLDWLFPGRAECGYCHGSPPVLLGPTTQQLSRDVCIGEDVLPQLDHLAERGIADIPTGAGLPDPADATVPIDRRARAWLHANCSHCHRPGGWTPPELTMDLRYDTAFQQTRTCEVDVQYWVGPTEDAVRIRAGDREASHLFLRLTPGDRGSMPPLGTSIPDPRGLEVVGDWIDSLESCP